MIENQSAVKNIDKILSVKGLDAIFIGPYDLSASLKLTGQFDHPRFKKNLKTIIDACNKHNIAYGIHIIEPSKLELKKNINKGYTFIAYSIDSVFLRISSISPL